MQVNNVYYHTELINKTDYDIIMKITDAMAFVSVRSFFLIPSRICLIVYIIFETTTCCYTLISRNSAYEGSRWRERLL